MGPLICPTMLMKYASNFSGSRLIRTSPRRFCAIGAKLVQSRRRRPMSKHMHDEDKILLLHLADMCAAMGTESRLKILHLLLAAEPDGMIVGNIQEELGIPASTLSHHLEKLRIAGLINVRRERQFLWCSVNEESLRQLLGFLYEECCSRNKVLDHRCVFPGENSQRHNKRHGEKQ